MKTATYTMKYQVTIPLFNGSKAYNGNYFYLRGLQIGILASRIWHFFRSWIHENDAVYYLSTKNPPSGIRRNWKIRLRVHKFLNIPDFKLVRWHKSCSWNRKTRPCTIVNELVIHKYLVREFLNWILPVDHGIGVYGSQFATDLIYTHQKKAYAQENKKMHVTKALSINLAIFREDV